MSEQREPAIRVEAGGGVVLTFYPADEMIDPVQRRPHERALVDIQTDYGYSFGIDPGDFDKLARGWIEYRTGGGVEPVEMPREPKLRTHASNARYGEKLRAAMDKLIGAVEQAAGLDELRLLPPHELRRFWHAANNLKKAIEREGARKGRNRG